MGSRKRLRAHNPKRQIDTLNYEPFLRAKMARESSAPQALKILALNNFGLITRRIQNGT
jgi:hypothetical protein